MSHASSHVRGKAVPAQLRFLAIYNPSLGRTDETRLDQIVYYYDGTGKPTRKAGKDSPGGSKEEENERLRHIGFAQGMVEFGKAFSQGESVDAIETEKSKIILHELEAGWWILASIDLTRHPKTSKATGPKDKTADDGNIEYSSRDVKPPILLLQDLLRAHAIFLLHHTSSIGDLFVTTEKPKFTSILGRYWDQFLSTWNVMLHGNPAVAVYNGIKIAGSGELGMGVGEEDRGSGEREVLEGFVGRIDGLVDLVVSRFGADSADSDMSKVSDQNKARPQLAPSEPWLGTGLEPGPNDGAIFLGVGALSRKSLRDVTHWMEDVYSWGPRAYGVKGNPARTRRPHRKGRLSSKALGSDSTHGHPSKARKADSRSSAISTSPVMINGDGQNGDLPTKQAMVPILNEPENKTSLEVLDPQPAVETELRENRSHSSSSRAPSASSAQSTKGGTLVDYLKLGYGTHWSLGGGTPSPRDASTSSGTGPVTPPPSGEVTSAGGDNQTEIDPANDSTGHYLVGLIGDVDADDPENSGSDGVGADTSNPRISLRTINVELDPVHDTLSGANGGAYNSSPSRLSASSEATHDTQNRVRKDLRVVVYANKPFLFTLFFEVATASLADSSVYRSLHYQLAPLQRPLFTSTHRKLPRPKLSTTLGGDVKTPIYDLMWDPKKLTICSTIPDIPSHSLQSSNLPVWSRLESLNTHIQILNMFAATRNEGSEIEQTCKTSRGYWVVWTRIPDPEAAQNQRKSEGSITPVDGDTTPTSSPSPSSEHGPDRVSDTNNTLDQASHVLDKADVARDKEIFLVRKASDQTSANAFAKENANSPAKLAQGIGVDTKRYIEGLLDMYR
ncbi:hypothetical protein V502_03846 [Pseudogymnoascus sp. VKM F-4520 (FW-2644)]|nr:hypothetical protein V502_03846 [Pseudogymnoascus sp. VKM F-4520 (FW-2644)]